MKTRPTSKLTVFFSPTLPHTRTQQKQQQPQSKAGKLNQPTNIKHRESLKKNQSNTWEIKRILHKNMGETKKHIHQKKQVPNLASILVSKRQMSKALALPFNLPLVAKTTPGIRLAFMAGQPT